MAFSPELLAEIRARFAHVDRCPFQGERVFFENAGGALTLKSVVETSAGFAAIPDNQGRDNIASKALVDIIQKARQDAHGLFNASGGQIFVGESGTELLFRLIRSACVASGEGGSAVFFVSNNKTGSLTLTDSIFRLNPKGTFETPGFPGFYIIAKADPTVVNTTIE